MAIDEIYIINTNSPEETPTLKKALTSIAEQAVGTQFVTEEPTQVPAGKMVIWDDGTTRRLYVKTGKGDIGYVTLTMVP